MNDKRESCNSSKFLEENIEKNLHDFEIGKNFIEHKKHEP